MRRQRLAYLHGTQTPGGVTLIRAPIGFGKTSLLRQWRGEVLADRRRIGWIPLTSAHRTPEGLLRALAECVPLLGVQSTPLTLARLREALRRKQAAGSVLFLDDWDALAGSEGEALLADLIGSGETLVHYSIASRRKPALPIEALLAESRLRLIGPDALRFSDSEQQRLLSVTEWSLLSNTLLAALDGWPLAFKFLKALHPSSDRGLQEPAVFARQSGLEDIVAAKLASACSEAEHALLPIFGLCGVVDLGMLEEISGRENTEALFEGLASVLPFQAFTEAGRLRNRPSPLLAPMLARRFEALPAAERGRIIRTAYERAVGLGRTVDALTYALQGGEAEKAIRLIESIGPLRLMMIYGVGAVQDILARLPLPLAQESFRCRLAIPITYAKRGCLVEAREMLELAVADIETSALTPVKKREALRDAMFARVQIAACSDSNWAVEFERAARGELAKDPAFAAWARVCSALVKHQTGRLDAASDDLLQAELACRQFGAAYQLMHLRVHRAHLDIAYGRTRGAARALRELTTDAKAAYPEDLGLLAVIKIARIETSLLVSRSSVPPEAIETALLKLRQGDAWYEPFASALTSMTRRLAPQGPDAILRWLDEAHAQLVAHGMTHVLGVVVALRAFHLALDGRSAEAQIALTTLQQSPAVPSEQRNWRERHLEGMARSLIASAHGARAAARKAADEVVADCLRDGRKAALTEAYLNRGHVLLAQGESREEALQSLALGIELASDLHVPGLLEDWRVPIERLAPTLLARLQPATAELLDRLRSEWKGTVRTDLLSGRELTVLKAAAAGLTNKQISRDIQVSVDTIKFHLKQCFRKLNVHSRTAAIEAARSAAMI